MKSKTFREVPFHPDLLPYLSEAVNNIQKGKILDYANETNLGKAISRYFEEIKINGKGYSARTFRKTFITLCRNEFNIDATILRELIGHSHRNVMDNHYNEVTIENMRRELLKFRRNKSD